ncbi:Putative uncharacterized protein [Bifidobacterium animalis subsp. animalis IM386]|uniref:Uncharacterized protein n=1 Tax=Bifidobacterium animalis subsp. animalis IM386 TaxID=1402194 RepID=A0AAV2W2K4_9BIFI|nr:Putative uncharacterized protein [Bifidobacterium animalis subsp. animalis IM386]
MLRAPRGELRMELRLAPIRGERCVDGVLGERCQFLHRHADVGERGIVRRDIASEICGVIRVDRAYDPFMQESGNRMLAHVVYDLQPEVRQRAAGERNAVACDALEQLAVVLNVDAVVDALGVQQIERIADIRRRALLAGVRHAVPAKGPCPRELIDEFGRWVADFRRIEPDAEDLGFSRRRHVEDPVRRIDIHVAYDAQNQATGDAEALAADHHSLKEAVEHHVEIQTIRAYMHLRIEENLGVLDPIRVRPCEIGEHEILEVVLRLQRLHQRIVEIEERLQILEFILRPQVIDAPPRQCHPIAVRQRQRKLRFERSLDMQMQFAFRHRLQCLPDFPVHHVPRSIAISVSHILPTPCCARTPFRRIWWI